MLVFVVLMKYVKAKIKRRKLKEEVEDDTY